MVDSPHLVDFSLEMSPSPNSGRLAAFLRGGRRGVRGFLATANPSPPKASTSHTSHGSWSGWQRHRKGFRLLGSQMQDEFIHKFSQLIGPPNHPFQRAQKVGLTGSGWVAWKALGNPWSLRSSGSGFPKPFHGFMEAGALFTALSSGANHGMEFIGWLVEVIHDPNEDDEGKDDDNDEGGERPQQPKSTPKTARRLSRNWSIR